MPKKRHNAEEIIHKIRGADALLSQGKTVSQSWLLRDVLWPEMVAKRLRQWLARLGTKVVYITPGSPWENGYCESFNDKRRVRSGPDISG